MKYFLFDDIPISIENYNNDFLLLKSQDCPNLNLSYLGEIILKEQFNFIEEIIASESEICLQINNKFTPLSLLKLAGIKSKTLRESRLIKVPVYFEDTLDWESITQFTSIPKIEYIHKLLELEFAVAMFGFLPGFVYMNGLPLNMHCPRKSNPSKSIQANTLAIGAQYIGIYSIPSPSGWHVIGHTALNIINVPHLPPNLLQSNDRIKLENIDKVQFNILNKSTESLLTYNGIT